MPQTYVASFCEDPDLLGLWRAYCPSGKGYNFGYDWSGSRASLDGVLAIKCLYNREEQEQALREVISFYKDRDPVLVREWFRQKGYPVDDSAPDRVLSSTLAYWLYMFSSILKDESFADEREWRVVWQLGQDDVPSYRASRSGIMVPYVEVPLAHDGELELGTVTVGPRADIDEARQAAERWLADCKRRPPASRFAHGQIKESKVPLRLV